jgi:uncharacterized protein (TIGR00730 family)
MQRVCVFAGASPGAREVYLAAARALGREIAQRQMGMVYGGASVGLMGACADAALAGGAEVVGVLPRALAAREIGHSGLTEMRIVSSLHERKAVMSALSDAVVALPGGCGTLDELFEAITWAQLGLHQKPIGLLDAGDFYAPLFGFLEHITAEGFVRPPLRLVRAATAADLLDGLFAAPPAAASPAGPAPRP